MRLLPQVQQRQVAPGSDTRSQLVPTLDLLVAPGSDQQSRTTWKGCGRRDWPWKLRHDLGSLDLEMGGDGAGPLDLIMVLLENFQGYG